MPRLLAIPLLALLGALAACGGSSDVSDPPPSRSSAVTSVPASPSGSVEPARETAKQFIRRWQVAADRMQTTGDVSAFRALNDSTCKSCASFEANVQRIYSGGGQIDAAPTEIIWIKQHGSNEYYVRERVPASRYRESPEVPWKYFAGGTDTQIFNLTRTNTSWTVKEVSQLAGSSS